jgi:uncharacterized protein
MSWIVLKEDKGKIVLISKKPPQDQEAGLLPKGSFLTIDNDINSTKFILRVDESYQNESFSPSPMIVDMDLSGLLADKQCRNIVYAYRVKDISLRTDGLIDFIHPQSLARRSNQEEIDAALGSTEDGPIVFVATIHSGQNQILCDEKRKLITAKLPEEIFFYQMQIAGKTGSGKTVATKYLAQYFAEQMQGAVLAINVKDVDFLTMDRPSSMVNKQVLQEWSAIGESARGINNYKIYYPANTSINGYKGITTDICEKITLKVTDIEPESLIGLLRNVSDIAEQSLPDIFRFWKEREMDEGQRFNDFVNYFSERSNTLIFNTLNVRDDESSIQLHRGTFGNILRSLNSAVEFFDDQTAKALGYKEIMYPGMVSVINVAGDKGTQFGSILLRHLLKQIVRVKSEQRSEVPVLVIIDEVHQFYNTESSKDALGDLDTICRTGRSQKIGVIFSSQNQDDLPKGLSSVINTKIFFKSDMASKAVYGVSNDEIQSLKAGYAIASIHDLPQLKILKFPLSFAGVV